MKERPCRLACSPVQQIRCGGFLLQRFHLPAGYALGEHAHHHSAIVIALDGAFRAITDRGEHTLHEGGLMTLSSDVAHSETAIEMTDCVIVAPDPEFSDYTHALYRRIAGIHVDDDCVSYQELFRLWFELHADDDLTELETDIIIHDIVDHWINKATETQPPNGRWLHEARQLLRQRVTETNPVRHTANDVGVTAEHLVRSFRNRFGITPGHFVRHRRLLLAIQKLTGSDASIAQIANDTGFSDQSHLTRMFRAHFRETPNKYRLLHK